MEGNGLRKLPWAMVALVLALVLAMSYVVAYSYVRITDNTMLGDFRQVGLTNIEDIQLTRDSVICYNGSYLYSISASGGTNWTYMIGSNADFNSDDLGIAVWAGDKLTIIDAQAGTTTYSNTLPDNILSAKVGSRYMAVVLEPEHSGRVILFNSAGAQTDDITFEYQTIIDYGFFSGGALFWVMTLDTSGTAPTSTISVYKPGMSVVGTVRDSDQLMYRVVLDSSNLRCVGENYIKTFNYKGVEDESRRTKVYGWTLSQMDSLDQSDPTMAFVPEGQYGAEIKDIRIVRSDLDQHMRFPFPASHLAVSGNTVYGFSKDGYIMVASVGSSAAEAYRMEISYDEVYGIIGGNTAVLSSGTSIYLVSLG